MNRRTLLALASASSTFAIAGCQEVFAIGDDDSTGRDNGSDADPELERTAAPPGTTVTLSSVPPELGEKPRGWLYDATVDEPDEDDRHPAFIDTEEEFLFVPPHPGDYMGGGKATIEFESEDGEQRYGPVDFEVEPLSPAPGTFEAALDTFESGLVEAGENFGVDRNELLAADPLSLPAPLPGLSAALQMVAADGAENNIRALLADDAPMANQFEEDDDGWEVAEAMMAEAGVPAVSATVTDQITNAEMDPEALESPEPAVGAASPAGTVGAVRSSGPSGDDRSQIAYLHRAMEAQAGFADLNSGMENFERNARNFLIGGAAFIPGAQKPAAALGALAFFEGLLVDIGEGTLPSEFVEFALDAAPQEYLEDEYDVEERTNAGEWEAALSASTEGWVFGLDDVLELAPISAGSIARHVDNYAGEVARLGDFEEQVIDYIADMTKTAFDVDVDSGPVSIDARTVGPIEVATDSEDDADLLNWELRQLDQEADVEPFAFLPGEDVEGGSFVDDERYEPRAVGRSELRIETAPDNFGGNYISANSIELEVHKIKVDIEDASDGTRPDIIRLDPDEDDLLLHLEAVIENAENDEDNEDIEWRHEVHAGPTVPEPEPVPGTPTEATFDLSGIDFSSYEQPDYVVEVEAVTEEGLRADLEPPRRDRVTVLITDEDEQLTVGPDPGCLGLDETHELSAALDGDSIDFEDLTWRIEGTGDGDIDPDGTFIPSAEGEIQLEFWLDDNRDVTSELGFVVSEDCNELYVQLREGMDTYSHTYTCIDSHGFPGTEESAMSQIDTHPEEWYTGATIELRMSLPGLYLPELPLEETQQTEGYINLKAEYDDGTEDTMSFGEATDKVPITITRRTVSEGALDGSDLDVFDGEFGPYTRWDDVTIEGDFTGVGWMEDRCGGFLVGPE